MAEDKGNVTVIIPVYNRVDFISQAIDSVLSQDGVDFEVIAVDDGSTDGSLDLLRQYEEAGSIRLLTHPGLKNKGQAASINLALGCVKGEFIAILDSDDLFAPGKLQRQVSYLQKHPDVGLVYGKGKAIDAQNNFLYDILSDDHVEDNNPGRALLDCYFHLPVNSLVRKSVYDEVGRFEEAFRAAQDHDMLIRMAEVTQFGFIPELVFYYRRHAGSISSNGAETRWMTGFEILDRARKRYPYPRSVIRKRAAVLNFRMGQVRLQQKRYGSALGYFSRAGLLDPRRAVNVLIRKEKV